LIPRTLFIILAWKHNNITAIINTDIAGSVCIMPSETISVVAPAGGCSTESKIMKNDVNAIERAAAAMNCIDIPEIMIACVWINPKISNERYPQMTPTR
jgi:hypothetical protein